MPDCPECFRPYAGRQCPHCARAAARHAKALNQSLNVPGVLLLVGLLGLILAIRRYPPLDRNTPYWIGLALFFVPLALLLAANLGKRMGQSIRILTGVFRGAALSVAALAALVFANGALDRAAAHEVRAQVVRKRMSRGRSSTTYRLVVESWRPGHTEETLDVSRRTYEAVRPEQPILVDVHPGRLGLSWYGQVAER